MNVDQIGEFLEHQGLSDEAIDAFFAHYGVKGQKWGVRRAQKRAAKGPDRFGNRNNPSAQRRLDRVKRVADGKASVGDMIKAGLFQISTNDLVIEGSFRDAAKAQVERGKRNQNKVNQGKKVVGDMLARLSGVDVRELNFD
jgi:hypothetical protein